MSKRLLKACLILLVCLGVLLVFLLRPAKAVVFRQLAEATTLQKLIALVNADFANRAADFPASLFATFDTGCSATLVGPNAILTAGHCASWSENITLSIKGDNTEAHCIAAPSTTGDLAMCLLDTPVENIVFDVIERDPALAGAMQQILLTGWAEPPPTNWFEHFLQALRHALGLPPPFRTGTGTIQSSASTLVVQGNPNSLGEVMVVLPGDSGGAGYAVRGTKRTIIGVNVCGGRSCTGGNDSTSQLTNLTDATVSAWIQLWIDDNGGQVCGYTNPVGCRP